jgi:hypothetical protein
MDLFYIIVLSILIIFLIIVLSYYGIVLQKRVKESKEYPPQPPSKCPDYWEMNVNGSCYLNIIHSVLHELHNIQYKCQTVLL